MTVINNNSYKICVHKQVTPNNSNFSINTILTYSLILENISNDDLEYVHIIEDIIDGLVYIPNSLKINGKRPSCGDINLNENAIIPIGNLLASNLHSVSCDNKVIVTFDVSISKVPILNPISNFCRVIYKYKNNNKLECSIINSNIVYSNFNIDIKNKNFIELVDDSTISHKSIGDFVEFKIILNPKNSIENVVLYDYISDYIELLSVEILRNGYSSKKCDINILKLYIGSINCGESITVVIKGKIKNSIQYKCCSLIKNQASIKYMDTCNCNTPIIVTTNPVYIYIHEAIVKSAKYANKECVTIGDSISYTINIENFGTVLLQDLTITDVLPTCLEYIKDSAYIQYDNMPPCKVDYNPSDGTIYVGLLDISESIKIILDTKVISPPVNSDNKIINNSSISYKYLKYPNDTNNKYEYVYNEPISKISSVCFNGADLLSNFLKKVSNSCDCNCNQINYELSFTNIGNIAAKKINISDIINGANLNKNSLVVLTNIPPGPKKYSGELPNISFDTILPNESIIIRFSALPVDNYLGKEISNYAKLSYIYSLSECSKPINVSGDSNTVYTTVHAPKIDSSLLVNESLSSSIFVNDNAVYKIKLKNISTSNLLSVSYKINFSNDFYNYIAYKANSLNIIGGTQSSLNINPNFETISIGTISPNEIVDISFTEIGLQKTPNAITCVAHGSYYTHSSSILNYCTNNTNLVSLSILDSTIPVNPNWCWNPAYNNCSSKCSYYGFNSINIHDNCLTKTNHK